MSIDIDIPEVAKSKYYTSGIKGQSPEIKFGILAPSLLTVNLKYYGLFPSFRKQPIPRTF